MMLSLRLARGLARVALLFTTTVSWAQSTESAPQPAADQPAVQASAQAPAGEARPQPEPLKLPDLPEVKDAVLDAWQDKTKEIHKLDGKVKRIEYDEVFKVEKQSEGKLYYEFPDKGRLDLVGLTFPQGQDGNAFKLAPGDTEKWVCDGQRIFQIDLEAQPRPQANVFAIPANQQGVNIMHGPLPFLFGMPREVAKKRFWLFLKGQTADTAHLVAYPKTAGDAQNYRYAEIILSKATFLPIAVKLRNPADNGSVIYKFDDVVQNRRWELRDPFVVDTRGMDVVNKVAEARLAQPGPPQMPSLVGLHGNDVARICKELGVKPRYLRGNPAANEDLKHRVYKQAPAKGAPIDEKTVIEVTLYDAPKS